MKNQPRDSAARMLETFLDPDFEQHRVWHPQELSAMLEHQWKAPFRMDLAGLPPQEARLLKDLCDAQGLCLKNYGDLFSHPMPPLELLEMIKDYAKRNLARPDQELPQDIAKLLYVLSVVVARLRCGKRITGQKDETVHTNIESVLMQPWITPSVAEILREGLKIFGDRPHASEDGNARPTE